MFLIFGEGNFWTYGLHPYTTDSSLLEFASNFTLLYEHDYFWLHLYQLPKW